MTVCMVLHPKSSFGRKKIFKTSEICFLPRLIIAILLCDRMEVQLKTQNLFDQRLPHQERAILLLLPNHEEKKNKQMEDETLEEINCLDCLKNVSRASAHPYVIFFILYILSGFVCMYLWILMHK